MSIKQGIRCLTQIKFSGVDADLVESAKFKFVQGSISRIAKYPSDEVFVEDNTFNIIWTPQQTFQFNSSAAVEVDAIVKLRGCEYSPKIKIGRESMMATLFTEQEVTDDA